MGSSPLHLPCSYLYTMNENAAVLVERKRYDEAIEALSIALETCKQGFDKESFASYDSCPCTKCSPRVNLSFLEQDGVGVTSNSANDSAMPNSPCRSSAFPIDNPNNDSSENSFEFSAFNSSSTGSNSSSNQRHNSSDNENSVSENRAIDTESVCGCQCFGYIHHRLISLPCRSLIGQRRMIETLPLILVFNLAIVHHLNAIHSSCRFHGGQKQRTPAYSTIDRALCLYHLVHKGLQDYIEAEHHRNHQIDNAADSLAYASSIHLYLILCNNLSNLHCLLGDRPRQMQCIERLTEVIMCVIDYRVREREDDEWEQERRRASSIDSTSSSSSMPSTATAATTAAGSPSVASAQDLREIYLEGFVSTISPSILAPQCARAA